MPLIELKNIDSDCVMAVWHIQESVVELSEILPKYLQKIDFELLNIEKQQQEWLSSRILVDHICDFLDKSYINLQKDLQKDSFGKPFLVIENQVIHLSISHSFPYSAVVLHRNKAVGIDIEQINPKLEKIAKRMFHADELQWATTLQDLALLWCAKEAMYKWYGKRGIDFRQHLSILQYEKAHIDKFYVEKFYVGKLHIGKLSYPETETHELLKLFTQQITDYQIVVCY